jgi:hypothetical protein
MSDNTELTEAGRHYAAAYEIQALTIVSATRGFLENAFWSNCPQP